MAGSLNGAWTKWERASEHAEALKREIGGNVPDFPGYYRYPITFEAEDPLHYSGYVEADFDPGNSATILGDMLFNLRAALDHIVYELHVLHFRGRVPADIEGTTAFPVHDWRSKTKKGRLTENWRTIGCLSARHRRAIENLQPYNRRKDKLAPTREHLSALSSLNNIDKHRHLHVVLPAGLATPVPTSLSDSGFESQTLWGPLHGKTKVLDWTFKVAPPEFDLRQMQMNRYMTATVTLDERGQEWAVAGLCYHLVETVKTVLNRFAVFFR